jgi:hypothetical protein
VFSRGTAEYEVVYACFVRTGRTWKLGTFQSDIGISNETIAGRFVAYQYLSCSPDCANSDVRVLDTRTGTVRRSAKAGAGASPMRGLVANRSGVAAWARHIQGGDWQVRALTPSGEAVIDSAPAIEPTSLAFAGSRLYWLNDGSPKSAVLK